MPTTIGMPTVQGFKTSLKHTGIGAVGGGVYTIGKRALGNGLFGGLIASGLTGAIVKGTPGETLSTIIGFRMAEDVFNGADNGASQAASPTMI